MKYVWILVAVILVVRIDLVVGLIDKGLNSFKSFNRSPEQIELKTKPKITPVKVESYSDDRSIVLALMANFQARPLKDVSELILEKLKNNQNIFTDKLDKQLEAIVFRLRDLLLQKNPETLDLIRELMLVLKEENLLMLRRFASLLLDEDPKGFLSFYSKTNDSNCKVAGIFTDPLSNDEKYNEFSERREKLKVVLAEETLDPNLRKLGENCMLVLSVEMDKLLPKNISLENPSEQAP